MDPLTALNLGIALAAAGIKAWADIKAITSVPQPDGSEDITLTLNLRREKLDAYLAQVNADQAETLAEIARRTEPSPPD